MTMSDSTPGLWQGGRGVHQGNTFGTGSGEGRSQGNVAQHSVRIHNHHAGQTVDVQVSLGLFLAAQSSGHSLFHCCAEFLKATMCIRWCRQPQVKEFHNFELSICIVMSSSLMVMSAVAMLIC